MGNQPTNRGYFIYLEVLVTENYWSHEHTSTVRMLLQKYQRFIYCSIWERIQFSDSKICQLFFLSSLDLFFRIRGFIEYLAKETRKKISVINLLRDTTKNRYLYVSIINSVIILPSGPCIIRFIVILCHNYVTGPVEGNINLKQKLLVLSKPNQHSRR